MHSHQTVSPVKQADKSRYKEHSSSQSPEKSPKTPRSRSSNGNKLLDLSRSIVESAFHQHSEQCLCKDCLCGRHLCKFETAVMSFPISTTYKTSYPPRKPYRHAQSPRPVSSKQPEQHLLLGSSTYLADFGSVQGDPLTRPKANNWLKCQGGPSVDLTSYKKQYPGHKGKNQYVPVNPEAFRGGLAFGSQSVYSKEYKGPRGKSAEKICPPDQFRMSGAWLNNSSYQKEYQNPKNHISKGDKDGKLYQSQCFSTSNNNYVNHKNASNHFTTTYGSQFRNKRDTTCPAAKKVVAVENDLAKSKFKQNSNFKGMDSTFTSLAKFVETF